MQIDIGSVYRCRNSIEVEIFDESSTYSFGIYLDEEGKTQGSYWYQDTGEFGPANKSTPHDMDLVEKVR